MSPLTLQSALLIMMCGGKQTGTPAHSVFIHPHQFVDLQRAWGSGWVVFSLHSPKINRGPLIMEKQERQRGGAREMDSFLFESVR